MYREDLSVYKNLKGAEELNTFCVGWLDEHHHFQKGVVGRDVLNRVLELCFAPVNKTRGFHVSPFRGREMGEYRVQNGGAGMTLGSAEIRVTGQDGRIYAAPNLVYHYMKDCGYCPPIEFVEAIVSTL